MLVNFALEDPTSDLIELGFHVFEHSFHNIKQRIPVTFLEIGFCYFLIRENSMENPTDHSEIG